MKKLSSDILFYQGLAGLIVGPVLIFFFIKYVFSQSFPSHVIPFFYVLLVFITIRGYYSAFKAKRISFDDQNMFLGNYFSKKFIQIPLNDVISIIPSFTLYSSTSGRKRYCITYMYDDNQKTTKFFKSLELYHVHNLENLIGLEKYKSVITNQHIQDSNSIIAASLKIDSTTRLTSAIMDHVIMTIVVMIFGLPYIIMVFLNKSTPKQQGVLFDMTLIGFALYFCKDCIYGQSIAKRILKQQVVNNKTGEIANPVRCFVRNIFIIIWPIELVVILITPQRRLGDIIAGTKVNAFDSNLKKPKSNIYK